MASFALSLAVGLATNLLLSVFAPTQKVESQPRDIRGPKTGFDQPIPKVYGRVRLGCSYLWAPKVRVEEETESQGGKGGGGGAEVTTYTYFADFACWACEGEVDFLKIWLNGNVVWQDTSACSDFEETKSISGVSSGDLEFSSNLTQSNYEGAVVEYQSENGDTISLSVRQKTSATTLELEKSATDSLAPNIGSNATIKQECGQDTFASIAEYPGSLSQNPDSLIQSVEGANETPAFRGLAYFVVDDLNLEQYGQSYPQSVEAEVQSIDFPNPTLQEIIEDICADQGLASSEYDASQLSGINVTGCIFKRDGGSARDFLQELQKLYFFFPVYADGKITFIPQSQSKIADILKSDLQPKGYLQRLIQPSKIPYEVQVSYFNFNDSYQRGVQYARREGRRDNTERIEVQSVLTDDRAKSIAQQLLTQFWIQRRQYENIELLPSWLGLNAGDVISLPVDGSNIDVQISKINIGANLLLEMEAVLYGGDTALQISDDTPSSSGDYTYTPAPSPPLTPTQASVIPFESNLRSPQDAEVGIYCAIAAASNQWSNGALYASVDVNTNYQKVAPITGKSYLGTCTSDPTASVLPSQWDGSDIIDTSTTLTIELLHGTLASVPQTGFDNNELVLLVGEEYIGVRDASLVSANTYNCSHLKRGLYGTENAITQHSTNEAVYVMRGGGATKIIRVGATTDYIGRTVYLKAVGQGQAVDTVTEEATITVIGTSLKPFAPISVQGALDDEGNIEFSWEARSRGEGLEVGEEETRFEIEILDSVGTGAGTVVRTLQTTSNTVLYPKEQQVSDLGAAVTETSGNLDVDIVVYKLSSLVGDSAVTSGFFRGYPATVYPVPAGAAITGVVWDSESEEFKGELRYSASTSAIADEKGKWLKFDTSSSALTYTLDNTLPRGWHAYVYVVGSNTLTLAGANTFIGETSLSDGQAALIVHSGNGDWVVDNTASSSGGGESDIVEVTTSRSIADSDRGNELFVDSSSDVTLTVDATNLTNPDNFPFIVHRKGTGKVSLSFTQTVGVAGQSGSTIEVLDQFGAVACKYNDSTSIWACTGNTSAIALSDLTSGTETQLIAGNGSLLNTGKSLGIVSSELKFDPDVDIRSSDFTLAPSDNGAEIYMTGNATITLPDSSTMGSNVITANVYLISDKTVTFSNTGTTSVKSDGTKLESTDPNTAIAANIRYIPSSFGIDGTNDVYILVGALS